MLKTIKMDKENSVVLSNNAAWTMEYMDQFGHDIVPDIMPVLSAVTNIAVGMAEELKETGNKLEFRDLAKALGALSGGSLSDAFAELAGLRITDMINVTWAMAKAADDDIPDPKTWVRQFEVFPLDKVVPVVLDMALSGMASAKNLKRFRSAVARMKETLEPSSSTTSSSQDSNED